jgi:hypothetical protein
MRERPVMSDQQRKRLAMACLENALNLIRHSEVLLGFGAIPYAQSSVIPGTPSRSSPLVSYSIVVRRVKAWGVASPTGVRGPRRSPHERLLASTVCVVGRRSPSKTNSHLNLLFA